MCVVNCLYTTKHCKLAAYAPSLVRILGWLVIVAWHYKFVLPLSGFLYISCETVLLLDSELEALLCTRLPPSKNLTHRLADRQT